VSAGEDPAEAVRTARLVNAFEAAFWATLAEGLDEG
jgi:predicted dinucleotide-binding enzyme